MHFPKHFLFGASLAGHQVEGNNTHSNWWHAEQAGQVPASGLAANHYQYYDADFTMAHTLGLNAMRISIEWSRIFPQQDRCDEAAVQHYHDVFKSLKRHGLMPMVTLFHWTMPQWVAEQGGFETDFGVRMFRRFIRFIAREYGRYSQLWLTINEPEVYAFESYLFGNHPPFKKNILTALRVYYHLIRAHTDAYQILKRYIPHVKVGVAKNVAYHEPYNANHIMDRLVVRIGQKFGNEFFVDRIRSHLDFIGLNYYFTHIVQFNVARGFKEMNKVHPKSDMGDKTYPMGLYYLLKRFERYNKPLYVTENGIANATDSMRARFITEHMMSVARARSENVPVKGYFYWSLIDTYEWLSDYSLKFGLAEVDFETMHRKPRISAQLFPSLRKK